MKYFSFSKFLGFAHAEGGEQVQVYLLTPRNSYQQIPGGSTLLGQVDRGRFRFLEKREFLPYVPLGASQSLVALVAAMEDDERDEEKNLPVVFYWEPAENFRRRLWLVAKGELEAVQAAYTAGLRVREECHDYPAPSWRRLLEWQKRV